MLFDERQVRDDFNLEWLIILRRMEAFVNQVGSNIVHFVHVSMCPNQVSVLFGRKPKPALVSTNSTAGLQCGLACAYIGAKSFTYQTRKML